MALIGYDPLPNGGYRFQRDDGTSASFMGPEAESMKAWIDQTRGPDQRTASNDPVEPMRYANGALITPEDAAGPPVAKADVAGDMASLAAHNAALATPPPSAQSQWDAIGKFDAKGNLIPGSQPQTQIVPGAGILAAPPPPAPVARVASTPLAPPGAPPAAPPPPPQRLAVPSGNPGKIPAQPSGEAPPMAMPGAAPPSTGAVDAVQAFTSSLPQHSGGGRPKLMLTGQTIEGMQETPEQAAAREKMLQTQQSVDDASLAEVRAAAAEKQAYFEQEGQNQADAALAAHDAMLKAQDHAATVQQAWDKTHAGLQREQDAVANQKIDPRRLFSGEKGTQNSIISAIAVGLGAFGASLNHGPNYAQQIIDATIQRDIDAQADAIHRKGANADNAMANFMRAHGLEPEEAKLAVKALGQQYAGSLAGIQAAKLGSIDAREGAAKLQADMVGNANKNWADVAAKVQQRVSNTLKLQGGSGSPKFKWITGEDGKARLFNTETGKIEQEVEGGSAYNVGSKKPGGESKPGDIVPRLSQSEAAAATGKAPLDSFEKLSKDASGISQAADRVGLGRMSELTSKAQNIAYIIARAETGGNVPPQERVDQIFHNLTSPSERTRQAQIDGGREVMADIHNANVDVSAKTAKIGTIDGSGQVDSGGGN